MKTNIELIESYLDELFPNPKSELEYETDYQFLIAIMLSAQSTDKRVNKVTKVLFDKYKSLEELSRADIGDLENIIHSVGSYHKKALFTKEIANTLYNEYDSKVPDNRSVIESLPGVGRKTANVFLSEFYNHPAIAVDTHVERVSKRLRLAFLKDDVSAVEKKLMKKLKKELWSRRHLQFVLFGRYYCKSVKPECLNCKLRDICREQKKNI